MSVVEGTVVWLVRAIFLAFNPIPSFLRKRLHGIRCGDRLDLESPQCLNRLNAPERYAAYAVSGS